MKKIFAVIILVIIMPINMAIGSNKPLVISNNSNYCVQILSHPNRNTELTCTTKHVWVIKQYTEKLQINVYTINEVDSNYTIINQGETIVLHADIGSGKYHKILIDTEHGTLVILYWSYFFTLKDIPLNLKLLGY